MQLQPALGDVEILVRQLFLGGGLVPLGLEYLELELADNHIMPRGRGGIDSRRHRPGPTAAS